MVHNKEIQWIKSVNIFPCAFFVVRVFETLMVHRPGNRTRGRLICIAHEAVVVSFVFVVPRKGRWQLFLVVFFPRKGICVEADNCVAVPQHWNTITQLLYPIPISLSINNAEVNEEWRKLLNTDWVKHWCAYTKQSHTRILDRLWNAILNFTTFKKLRTSVPYWLEIIFGRNLYRLKKQRIPLLSKNYRVILLNFDSLFDNTIVWSSFMHS